MLSVPQELSDLPRSAARVFNPRSAEDARFLLEYARSRVGKNILVDVAEQGPSPNWVTLEGVLVDRGGSFFLDVADEDETPWAEPGWLYKNFASNGIGRRQTRPNTPVFTPSPNNQALNDTVEQLVAQVRILTRDRQQHAQAVQEALGSQQQQQQQQMSELLSLVRAELRSLPSSSAPPLRGSTASPAPQPPQLSPVPPQSQLVLGVPAIVPAAQPLGAASRQPPVVDASKPMRHASVWPDLPAASVPRPSLHRSVPASASPEQRAMLALARQAELADPLWVSSMLPSDDIFSAAEAQILATLPAFSLLKAEKDFDASKRALQALASFIAKIHTMSADEITSVFVAEFARKPEKNAISFDSKETLSDALDLFSEATSDATKVRAFLRLGMLWLRCHGTHFTQHKRLQLAMLARPTSTTEVASWLAGKRLPLGDAQVAVSASGF
jgi:hypothetical protein